jgi:hypothetical protein
MEIMDKNSLPKKHKYTYLREEELLEDLKMDGLIAFEA